MTPKWILKDLNLALNSTFFEKKKREPNRRETVSHHEAHLNLIYLEFWRCQTLEKKKYSVWKVEIHKIQSVSNTCKILLNNIKLN